MWRRVRLPAAISANLLLATAGLKAIQCSYCDPILSSLMALCMDNDSQCTSACALEFGLMRDNCENLYDSVTQAQAWHDCMDEADLRYAQCLNWDCTSAWIECSQQASDIHAACWQTCTYS